jgi:ribosomal protein S18 acetylase RimI-like enzyme
MAEWRYEAADFDTRLLGVPVGRVVIHGDGADIEATARAIEAELAAKRPSYVSARVDERDRAATQILERVGFRLVDSLRMMELAELAPFGSLAPGATVREAREEDGPAFRAIMEAGYANRLAREPHLDPAKVRALYAEWAHNDLRGRTAINLLAIDGGTPAGFIAMGVEKTDASVGFVDMVVVHPSARGKRLGEALMLGGLRRFVERGGKRVWLGVAAANRPAGSLYEKLHFVETGVKLDYARWLG